MTESHPQQKAGLIKYSHISVADVAPWRGIGGVDRGGRVIGAMRFLIRHTRTQLAMTASECHVHDSKRKRFPHKGGLPI